MSAEHSMTAQELEKYVGRQRKQLRSCTWAMGLALLMIIVATHGQLQDNRLIAEQEKLIQASNDRIVSMDRQIKALEKEVDDLLYVQALNKVSRGTERTATITAYTWTGDKTASGTWPKEGRTVAGPRNIPFGTVVWIDGVGERIVEDRTHSRYDGRYDVYMDSEADCIKWGIQQRVVR